MSGDEDQLMQTLRDAKASGADTPFPSDVPEALTQHNAKTDPVFPAMEKKSTDSMEQDEASQSGDDETVDLELCEGNVARVKGTILPPA